MGFLSKFPMARGFNADSDREVLMKGVRDQAGEAAAHLGHNGDGVVMSKSWMHFGGKPRRITWPLFWPLPIHCQPLGTSGLFDVYTIYVYIDIDAQQN